jgi:hypothetical protein
MTRAERQLPAERSPDPLRRDIYRNICTIGATCRDDWRQLIDKYIDRIATPQNRNLYDDLLREYLSHCHT